MLLRNYFNWKYNFQNKYQNAIGTEASESAWVNEGYGYILDSTLGLTKISNADDKIHLGLRALRYSDYYNSDVWQNYGFDKNVGACVGEGTTAADVGDTALEAMCSSDVSCSMSTVTFSNNEDFKIVKRYTIIGKNNGPDSVTISEVGVYKQFYANNGSQYGFTLSSNKYLMLRQILPTPITVAAGKEYQITLEVVDDLALTQN